MPEMQLRIDGGEDVVTRAAHRTTAAEIISEQHLTIMVLNAQMIIALEALEACETTKPLRRPILGSAQCRQFPQCNHAGCEAVMKVNKIAGEARAKIRKMRLASVLWNERRQPQEKPTRTAKALKGRGAA